MNSDSKISFLAVIGAVLLALFSAILAWSGGFFANSPPTVSTIAVVQSDRLADRAGQRILLGPVPEVLRLRVTPPEDDWGSDNIDVSWSVSREDGTDRVPLGKALNVEFRPTSKGRFIVEVEARDQGNGLGLNDAVASQTWLVTVEEPIEPEARIRAQSSTDITLGETFRATASGSQFEQAATGGPTLNWRVQTPSLTRELGSDSTLSFRPSAPGEYTVFLELLDQFEQRDEASILLSVSPAPIPSPRVELERHTVSPNEIVIAVGRPQADQLAPSWNSVAPSGNTSSGSGRTFAFSSNEPGQHRLEFTISDAYQQSRSTNASVTVLNSTVLNQTSFTERSGTRVYDFSGQEVILTGTLETNGVPIELVAHTIRSEEGIVRSFASEFSTANAQSGDSGNNGRHGATNGANGSAGGNGTRGSDGRTGSNAGSVSIIAQRLIGHLTVDNSGMAGGNGGDGGDGGRGGNGANGNSGASGAFDCRRGPQSGGNGANGGRAGDAGNGGSGGNGGEIKVVIAEPLSDDSGILAVSAGGSPGNAGSPGTPGQRGEPGARGSAPGLCRQTARNGSPGTQGASGASGADGKAGENGSITVIVDGEARVASGELEL